MTSLMQHAHIYKKNKNNTATYSISALGGQINFSWKSGFVIQSHAVTFTVGIIVSQWAEAILTNTAVSCLQVHAVGVLHAAVAL